MIVCFFPFVFAFTILLTTLTLTGDRHHPAPSGKTCMYVCMKPEKKIMGKKHKIETNIKENANIEYRKWEAKARRIHQCWKRTWDGYCETFFRAWRETRSRLKKSSGACACGLLPPVQAQAAFVVRQSAAAVMILRLRTHRLDPSLARSLHTPMSLLRLLSDVPANPVCNF